MDIFGGSSQNWASLRVISMQFRGFFLKSRYRNWDNFLDCLNFKYFLGVLETPDIFGGER